MIYLGQLFIGRDGQSLTKSMYWKYHFCVGMVRQMQKIVAFNVENVLCQKPVNLVIRASVS